MGALGTMHQRKGGGLFLVIILFVSLVAMNSIAAEKKHSVTRVKFPTSTMYLIVEILDDNLAHFELSAKLPGPPDTQPIYTTPMVAQTDYSGPKHFKRSGQGGSHLETSAMSIDVDTSTLCVTYTDKIQNVKLTELCPLNLNQYWKGFTLSRETTQNIYGLGQEFQNPGVQDGDWMGKIRHFGGLNGNAMNDFNGGANGNTQIPILYALGAGKQNYALFLDQVYQQQWDFTADPMTSQMYGDQIRWYFFTGKSLPDLRTAYMNLVGHPLVPPKKMFGLWVSQYGYRNWDDMESKLSTLRLNLFPIDGFFLDLFWFGGIQTDSDNSSMGKLTWDTTNFPSPETKIPSLRDQQGIGIITIEESYISQNLPEHQELGANGYLVKDSTGNPAYLTQNSWWGRGGMIDWTNTGVWDFWHQMKRVPLINQGIMGHWLDLGEPEIWSSDAHYAVGPLDPDVHNIYNLRWIQSIYQGYQHFSPDKRPFMMSRSGAAGIQRYGAAMWSGDIGSNLPNLAAHQHSQMNMSLSGIDYYGADIGGFHREALGNGDLNEMYTQWFAYGMLFDVPGRPHTENLCQCRETAPDRVGDLDSNLDNLRLRYQLIPYTYSLAHRANLYGEPVFPPLVYYFQDDANTREIAHEKMIGPSLLAGVVAEAGAKTTDVYLPQGNWIDFRTDQWTSSQGQTLTAVPLFANNKYILPLYARAGSILPLMYVDDKTENALGLRSDGTTHDELWARVYPDAAPSSFTLFEDDGSTSEYLTQQVRTTEIRQSSSKGGTVVSIAPAQGTYSGAPDSRDNVIELIAQNTGITEVDVNGDELAQATSMEEWQQSDSGWFAQSATHILVRTGELPVSELKTITFR